MSGPNTEPTVPPMTTLEMARPRSAGGWTSAAAKRPERDGGVSDAHQKHPAEEEAEGVHGDGVEGQPRPQHAQQQPHHQRQAASHRLHDVPPAEGRERACQQIHRGRDPGIGGVGAERGAHDGVDGRRGDESRGGEGLLAKRMTVSLRARAGRFCMRGNEG